MTFLQLGFKTCSEMSSLSINCTRRSKKQLRQKTNERSGSGMVGSPFSSLTSSLLLRKTSTHLMMNSALKMISCRPMCHFFKSRRYWGSRAPLEGENHLEFKGSSATPSPWSMASLMQASVTLRLMRRSVRLISRELSAIALLSKTRWNKARKMI